MVQLYGGIQKQKSLFITTMKAKKSSIGPLTSRGRLFVLGAVLLVLVVFAGWMVHRHKSSYIPTISSGSAHSSSGAAGSNSKASSSTASAGTSNKSPQSTTNNNSSQTQVTLLAPSGNFVSNHSPGQNGSPSQETSVCNTSPGASCYISFTQGNIVKQLAPKTADANGSVYWDWDINSAGLSSGSWRVQAKASLNGQTKTTSDSMPLVIQ